MKNTLKSQLAKSFSGNMELNKRALQMKNSFDEINGILGKGLKKKSNKKQSQIAVKHSVNERRRNKYGSQIYR